MLEKVRLQNFRCFDQHRVTLRPLTVVVGANNAGKSTLVEALRLLALVVNRYRGLTYRAPPAWTDLPMRCHGVFPSTKDIDLRGGSVFHRYGDPPAKITGTFSSGCEVEVFIGGDNQVFGVITDKDGKHVQSKSQAAQLDLFGLEILPQIGPLLETEELLNREYVLRSLSLSLASRHFRNQLHYLGDQFFRDFQQRAERSWPGLHIESLDVEGDVPNQSVSLLVRDANFVAEIGWMGHGLQMWLQTMWFLARAQHSATVILDEPDVYMHADLQRRLVRLLRGRHTQTIIATHSVEIMSEVGPDEILIVDKRKRESSFASSLPAVQNVIERLGGVQNIHLARLWGSRRCLHVEGKDTTFLKIFQDKIFADSDISFLVLPRISIGGWSGWSYAIGSAMSLRNAAGEAIASYCILDSDYHTDEEIQQRYEEADRQDVRLHIWNRKEIENYLLVPSAIHRIVSQDLTSGVSPPTLAEVERQLFELAGELRNDVFDALAHEFLIRNRAGGIAEANRNARDLIENSWDCAEGRFRLVSGKALLSSISRWAQQKYRVSFGATRVARELHRDEIAPEVVGVVRAIERGQRFPRHLRTH